MQLLIILALLLYGGKNGGGNILSEVKPVLESLGGEQVKEALKSAEEISQVLSAVQEFTSSNANPDYSPRHSERSEESPNDNDFSEARNDGKINFPLSPISSIADKDITYSLSRYITQN